MPIVEAAPLSEVTNPILYSARAGESEAAASTAAVTPAINPAGIIAMIHSSDLLRRNEDAPARERAPLEPIPPIQRHFGLAHKQTLEEPRATARNKHFDPTLGALRRGAEEGCRVANRPGGKLPRRRRDVAPVALRRPDRTLLPWRIHCGSRIAPPDAGYGPFPLRHQIHWSCRRKVIAS